MTKNTPTSKPTLFTLSLWQLNTICFFSDSLGIEIESTVCAIKNISATFLSNRRHFPHIFFDPLRDITTTSYYYSKLHICFHATSQNKKKNQPNIPNCTHTTWHQSGNFYFISIYFIADEIDECPFISFKIYASTFPFGMWIVYTYVCACRISLVRFLDSKPFSMFANEYSYSYFWW